MTNRDRIKTSETLVEKLKDPSNEKAWDRFYRLYSRVLFQFIRSRGVDHVSAEDILQISMCEIIRYIPSFEYDPKKGKFSSYLFRIVFHVISKWVERNKNHGIPLQDAMPIYDMNISDPRSRQMFEEFEQLWKRNLINYAFMRVKKRVEPLTWKSFHLFVLKGQRAQEVATRLGIPNRSAVFKQKERVLGILKEEVKKVMDEIGDFEVQPGLEANDYRDQNLKTSYLDDERPRTEVRTRIEILRKLYINHPPPGPWSPQFLVITSGNSRWVDIKGKFYVGAAPQCTLKLNSELVSRQHCVVSCDQNVWCIRDLRSKNGVIVNNKPVSEKILDNGDIITLGDIELIFISKGNVQNVC